MTRQFYVLIRRQNWPGQSDSENGIRPGQLDSEIRIRPGQSDSEKRDSKNGIRPGQSDFRAKDMGYGEVLWGTF